MLSVEDIIDCEVSGVPQLSGGGVTIGGMGLVEESRVTSPFWRSVRVSKKAIKSEILTARKRTYDVK